MRAYLYDMDFSVSHITCIVAMLSIIENATKLIIDLLVLFLTLLCKSVCCTKLYHLCRYSTS